ncbi:aminotransferase class I/II-fold pyridoxal phosphate-dependent enzyme [Melioribacteraceae bacterium 4301-Me]|uniref:aminotransferase class I/II-fold pyridoxal phosphate-dependent enzyme n=1 Tax=Pyranulibacter aquaticus TaxID=3163344 RepID=UPI0035994148
MNKKFYQDKSNIFLMESAPGAQTIINGKLYNYFGGTSYYELHNNKEVINAAIKALNKYGINSSSSRNSYGTTPLLLEVEKQAAEFFNCEDSVYLASGFLSDIAAVQALVNMNLFDSVFIDEISHYSNNYAAKISGKKINKFSHLNPNDLEEKIKKTLKKGGRPLVITDGIFPITGKIAPIKLYLNIVKKYDGIMWIDDAHALGVIGENGRGTAEHYKLKSKRLYFGGTMSKALGGFGGIIPGSKKFILEIKQSYTQFGSTPPPSSAAAASLMGLKILKENPQMKIKLWENARKLKNGLKNLGVEVDDSVVPIAAFNLDSYESMRRVHQRLMEKRIMIQLINYIGAGKSGSLRIVVFSTHTEEQIEHLLYELGKIL